MKALIILLVVLSIWQCSSQNLDFGDIPEKQLKELEQALNFNKARANSQKMNAFKSGFFNQLFNQNQDSNEDKAQPEKKKMSLIIKELPYEVLLPRRRSSPLDLFGKLFKEKSRKNMVQIESQSDPLDQLNQLIGQKSNKEQNVYWQNPDFKKGQKQIPFRRIFGQKSRTHRDLLIEESLIERLLVQAMPNLKGGKILKLSSVPYQKGIYLHIEYSGEKGQLYTIKAKYRRRNNQLQIISLNQITLSPAQQESFSQSYSEQIKDKPKKDETLSKEAELEFKPQVKTKQILNKKEVKIQEKKPQQKKRQQSIKEQLQNEKKQNIAKEPAKETKQQKIPESKDVKVQTKQSKEVKEEEKKEVNEVKKNPQAKSQTKIQQKTIKKQQTSNLKKQSEEKREKEKQAQNKTVKSIQSN